MTSRLFSIAKETELFHGARGFVPANLPGLHEISNDLLRRCRVSSATPEVTSATLRNSSSTLEPPSRRGQGTTAPNLYSLGAEPHPDLGRQSHQTYAVRNPCPHSREHLRFLPGTGLRHQHRIDGLLLRERPGVLPVGGHVSGRGQLRWGADRPDPRPGHRLLPRRDPFDLPSRRLHAHHRQHAVPLGVRQQRRGLPGARSTSSSTCWAASPRRWPTSSLTRTTSPPPSALRERWPR